MEIVPFRPEHLQTIILQDAQSWMGPMLKPGYGEALVQGGPCFTAIADGQVLACSGVIRMWDNRDQAWALISSQAGPHFIGIYRGMRRFLDMHDARRVEATVDADFLEGHRLMRMLGFQHEGLMRAYLMDGRDCDLYARIRG